MVIIMANYITLGFNILCITLLVTGMFWGLVRGLKKTVSRFIFLLVLGIALIFLTIPITNALLNIKISTAFISEEGEVVRQVPVVEFLSILLQGLVGKNFVIKYPEFSELIIVLPLTIVYVVVFVVLFWVLKLILLPLNMLINHFIFNRRPKAEQLGFAYNNGVEYPNSDSSIEPLMEVYKNAERAPEKEQKIATVPATAEEPVVQTQVEKPKSKKQLKKEQKLLAKEDKPKKYRLLGSLVGAFIGVMLIFFTMVPFYGIVNIADNIKGTKINNLTEEPTTLNDLTNGLLVDIVKGYDLSALGRISDALAIEGLGITTFDHLTTATIKDTNISLREDINAIVDTVVQADSLIGKFKIASDKGLENLTQAELDDLINTTDAVIIACSDIKFVNSMTNYILPLVNEIIKTNEIKFINDAHLNFLVMDMLETLADEPYLNIFNELSGLVEIARYINTQGLLHPLITGNTTDIVSVIDGLDEDFGEQLSTKIFNIKAVDTVFPQVLNISLEFFDKATEFGYVENTATKAELKASMTQLITSVVDTARTLSADSSIYLTDNSIIELGKVLDTFRNSKLFNIETYNNLVDYTMNQVKTMTTEIVPANFTDAFNNKLLRNVGEVESWQTEMKVIYDTIQILRDKGYGFLGDIVEGEEKRVGYSANFSLTEGTLINLGKALDNLEKSTLLGSDGKITLNDQDYTNTTLISLFSALLNEIYENIATEEENTTTTEILSIINNMNDNLVLSCHTYTNDSTYWEDEFTAIAPLVVEIGNIAEDEEFELTADFGTKLDSCAHNSVMLGGNTTLVLMEKLMAVVQDGILGENFAPVGDGSMNDKIYNIFVAMRNNLLSAELYNELQQDEHFWQTEIDSILSLGDIADKASTITSISSAMTIAEDLDKVYSSRIIPTNELNDTLATVLRQLKTSSTTGIDGKINSLIEEIATDISSSTFWNDKDKTNFWTIELECIRTLSDTKFEDEGEYKVVDNLSSIGADIDSIVFGNSSTRASYLITENRIRDILSFVVSDMSTSIANGFEEGALKSTITSTLTTIATNLYDSTEDEQVEINSFERELGNLSKLANLDINSDLFKYTNNPTQLEALENKLSSIGASLDSIAYNTTTSSDITSYLDYINSNIITRPMIANIISSAFSTAKIVETSADPLDNIETAFNTLIENIQDSILAITTENKVMSWARELSYVSTLIQLNSGEVFTIENAATDIGKNIDKIAFNHKDNAFLDVNYNSDKNIVGKYVVKEIDNTTSVPTTIYYNSVIITRDILKTAVNSMVVDFKVAEPDKQEEIANELIDNLSTRVSTTTYSPTIYNDYESALTDLNAVKTTMETTADTMAEVTVDNFGDEHITTIDNMLDSVESKIICGTATTRKIAVMLVEDFKVANATTDEDQIINEIIDNLISKINNGEVSDYAIVFTELKDIQNEITTVKSKFDSQDLIDFSREELVAIDQMLESLQEKTICGTVTTRKVANLMVKKAKDSLTNNGENQTIMSTEVGTYINTLTSYYSTSTAETEVYYSTTSSSEMANPMATIYDKLIE